MKAITAFTLWLIMSTARAVDMMVETKAVSTKNNTVAEVIATMTSDNWWGMANASSTGYRQIYAGPKLSPTDWSEIGLGVGAETVGKSWGSRAGGYVWAGNEKWSGLVAYENGEITGPWHKAWLMYKAIPIVSVGMQTQAFQGGGLRVEINPAEKAKIFGTVLRKGGMNTVSIGVDVSF